MAYAVTFGGTLTLIGTSTNLVVTGLMEKRYGKDGQLGQALKKFATPELQKQFLASDEGLRLRERAYYGFFEITPYGIPYAVAGLLYLWLASPALGPGISPFVWLKKKKKKRDTSRARASSPPPTRARRDDDRPARLPR